MTAVPLRLIDDIGMRKRTSAAAKDLMEDHLTHYAVRNIPKLTVSKQLRKPPTQHDPSKNYQFRYRAKRHSTLPHVVKFSGGRSSGMLLFTLLENKILNADRGDVILFNNTSAEHPDTYRFAQDCNKASNRYGIPSFWVEFQTYEDARNGEWTRLPSYRLVNDQPKSPDSPGGFHWRGEVFEELLSWSGYVPNQFARICTQNMKLEATRLFLKDWLASKETIPRLGHYGKGSRVDLDTLHQRHRRNGGAVPEDILLRKRAYALARPHVRAEQRYADFSQAWRAFENRALKGKAYGEKAWFGDGGVEYVAFVGLRGDEQVRVKRVEERNAGPGASGYEGEHVYMPLADMAVARDDVNAFWDRQDWGLSLPQEGSLSNCVYCFLKGIANLRSVHDRMEQEKLTEASGFGSILDTPCDIAWWRRIEAEYSRDLEAEHREIRGDPKNTHIGFFGARGFSYDVLAKSEEADLDRFSDTLLPCDCTE